MIAVAGAAFLAASQANAQITYNGDDLLLNFRNTANVTGNDLEVDAGQISAFTALTSTKVVVSSSLFQSVYGGAPSVSLPVGFSAAAGDDTSSTVWMTRADTTPGTAPSTPPSQGASLTQNEVVTAIDNIGAGAAAGTAQGAKAATVTGATTGNSYQAQAEQNNTGTGQGIINFGSHENVAANKGGNIESIQTAAGPVYEALWEVPVSGTGSDTYEGYFTFQNSGEVDYTPAVVATPEPSTYALFAVAGALALAFRRQLRSVFA
jgi:hypothetical protein